MNPTNLTWALPIALCWGCTAKEPAEKQSEIRDQVSPKASEPSKAAPTHASGLSASAIAALYDADLCTTVDAARMAEVLGLAEGTEVRMRGGFVGTTKSCRYSWDGVEEDERAINVSFPMNPQGHANDIKKSVETQRAGKDTLVDLPGHAAFWNETHSTLSYYPDAVHSLQLQLASGKLPTPLESAKAIVMEFIAK